MDKRRILSTVLIGTMLCSASASAKINKVNTNTTKPIVKVQSVKNEVKKLVLYQGEIVKKTATKNGFDLLVKKLDRSSYSYQSLIFHVNNKTVLKVKKEDLKPGYKIDVLYSGAVTRSLPGQATANEISNLNLAKTTFLYQGKVTDVSDTKFGKMVTVISDEEKPIFDTVIFIVSNNTKIINGTMSDIKEGLSVKLTHGPAMTMSLPPQTNALSLEIQKVNTTDPVGEAPKELALYQGEIIEKATTKNGFDILVKKLDRSSYPYQSLIFHIDNKTVLKVNKEDLKPGYKIDILYSGAVTRSFPGQATASEISNLNLGKTTFAYQGKVTNVSDTKFGKMVTVVSNEEKPINDTVVFIVSNNTKIINGTVSDIKEGLNVKLTHGPAMTMSLPPQTNALSLEIQK